MKLSVIIPVYNAEAYLQKCVESVMEFPFEKEIILVDDGSKDRSGEICDQFQVPRSRFQDIYSSEIKVIHQENRGVSAARNAGLDVATGDYVWFVDADDTVISDSRFQVPGFQDQDDVPLVIFGFVWDENGEAKTFGASEDEVPYNLWRCWFNRRCIEAAKLRFTEGRKYAEDQEFILKFMVESLGFMENDSKPLVSAIPEPIYYYTLRPGSAMTRKGVKTKKIKDITAVLFGFAWNAISAGLIGKRWVWCELKRMAKCLYITLIR